MAGLASLTAHELGARYRTGTDTPTQASLGISRLSLDGRLTRRGADGGQGPAVHARDPHHLWVQDPGRLRAALRRHRGRAAVRGGRGPARQAQHGRVRDGLVHRELRVLHHLQPVGPGPRAGRLLRRRLRGGGRGHGAAHPRHRHRRLDPAAGRVLGRGRPRAQQPAPRPPPRQPPLPHAPPPTVPSPSPRRSTRSVPSPATRRTRR